MNTSTNIMSLNTASGTKTVSNGNSAKSVKKTMADGTSSNKSSKQDSFSNVLDKSTGDDALQVDTAVNADDVAKDPISAAIASAQAQNAGEEAAQSPVEESAAQTMTTVNQAVQDSLQTAGETLKLSNSIDALLGNNQKEASGVQNNQLLEMLTGNTTQLQNQFSAGQLQQNNLNTVASNAAESTVQNLETETVADNNSPLLQNVVLKSPLDESKTAVQNVNAERISDSAKESVANLLGNAKVEVVQTDNFVQNNTTGQLMKANLLEQQQQSFQQGEQSAFSSGENPFQETVEQPAQVQPANTGISAFQQTLHTADVETNQQVQETQQGRTDYDIPKQIVEQARLIRSGENTEMVIRLRPEHLGNLTLRISVTGNGAVNATFHSDNAQVRAIIESSMVQLKQDLENQGLKVNNVEVYSGLSDGLMQGGQSQSEYQQQQSNAARHSKLDMDSLEDDMEQLNAVTEETFATEDGVDYRV